MALMFIAAASAAFTSRAATAGPAERSFEIQLRVAQSLETKLNLLADIADASAARLLTGGNIFLAGEKGMVAEMLGRAGGLCGAKALALDTPLPALVHNDVVLLSDYGTPGTLAASLEKLAPTGALVITFASAENPLLHQPPEPNVRFVPVDISLDSCLVRSAASEPLLLTAAPAIATAQWTYAAELLAACRRQHKQLAIYLSIHLDDGHRRYDRTKGLLFEPDLRPDPVARGEYGRSFLRSARRSLEAIRDGEMKNIRQAALWLREASAARKQIVRNLMGHLPPAEAGLRSDAPFFTQITRLNGEPGAQWIRDNLHDGDLYFFLGYQKNEDAMAAAAHAAGARTIFLTSTAPGAEQAKDPRHLYINPHWPLTDACLDLSGYDVKACPLSCIAGMTCYDAVCAEAVCP